jgi:4-amino-4-deoxy-L-arabinose transferase-like glycosyltransferase
MNLLSIEGIKVKIAENKEIILILVLSIVIRLLFLNLPELRSRDEALYASASRSFLQNPFKPILISNPIPGLENNQLFPHIFLTKPPLIFWLTAASYNIFGINEFAVRFVPAVFGVFSIIITYMLAEHIFNKKIALFSSLLLSICQFHIKYSRQGMLDVPLTFFVLLTLFLFLKGFNSESESPVFFILAGISQGLGILTKWHAALFPTFTIILFILLLRKNQIIFSRNFAFYLLAVLLSILPWLIYIYVSFPETARAVLLFEIAGRPFTEGPRGPFWFFSRLMWGLTPWGPIVLIAVIYSFWKRTSGDIYLLLIIGTTFIAYDISYAKLTHYILPIVPFLLILTARFIYDIINFKEKIIILLLISFVGSVVYVLLVGVFPTTVFGVEQIWFIPLISVVAVLYYGLVWFYINKRLPAPSMRLLIILFVLPLFISNLAFAGADSYSDVASDDLGAKEIGQYIKLHSSEDDLVFCSDGIGWAILFYSERSTYEYPIIPRETFEDYILSQQVKFVVISEEFLSTTNYKVNFVLMNSVEVNIAGVSPSLHVYSII